MSLSVGSYQIECGEAKVIVNRNNDQIQNGMKIEFEIEIEIVK